MEVGASDPSCGCRCDYDRMQVWVDDRLIRLGSKCAETVPQRMLVRRMSGLKVSSALTPAQLDNSSWFHGMFKQLGSVKPDSVDSVVEFKAPGQIGSS